MGTDPNNNKDGIHVPFTKVMEVTVSTIINLH